MKTRALRLLLFAVLPGLHVQIHAQPATIRLQASATLRAVEVNRGERFSFELANGQRRDFELVDAGAQVLLTNLRELKKPQNDGGTIYVMRCTLRVNGQLLALERYVGPQESFYTPLVIDGVRLWFDGVRAAENILTFNHGSCLPRKDARFALQDATQRICPEEVLPWFSGGALALDIAHSYAGSDCWMGGYKGAEAHGGLDINQPKGSAVLAPFDLDDHFLFETLEAGANNNRGRGLRRWPNGDLWTVQVHHMLRLLAPEHTRIKAGERFALGAGVNSGTHEHVHYNFKVTPAGTDTIIDLDPWILFWQSFEDERVRRGEIRAAMAPLAPVRTGEKTSLRSTGSRPGLKRAALKCTWAISDGAILAGEEAEHVFAAPGVYAVTLTVDDGGTRAMTTQHVTVQGERVTQPVLSLRAPDLPTFWPRRVGDMDVYGREITSVPGQITLLARPTSPRPEARIIFLENVGGGALREPRITIDGEGKDARWLAASVTRAAETWRVGVQADATGLAKGRHRAQVHVECPGALNGAQSFGVIIDVVHSPAMHWAIDLVKPGERGTAEEVRVDDASGAGAFFATPWFWIGHRFAFWPEPRGYRGFSLTNGGRASERDFARFTPDLAPGRFEVSLHPQTPFSADARFQVRVHHRGGDTIAWVEPAQSRAIGTFDFAEGMDGYVEVLARGARGQVSVDCVVFRRIGGPAVK